MGDESEWMKLPTDQKVEHKAWKARIAGYEEVTKAFATAGDEKAPIYGNYQGVIRKFVTETNAIAQEKAMDAVLAYMENASSNMIGRIASDVCSGMVTKCLNASRTKTKEKTLEVFMLVIEAEKQEFVQEELLKGLGNKQPKIVVGAIQTLREAMTCFGPKIIQAKPLMKATPKLLEDRDKNVRDETKLLIIEIYRWIGPAIKAQMTSLKPIQLTELETEFANLPGGTPKQTRFLRSQQDLKAKLEAQAEAGDEAEAEDDEEDEEAAVVMDAYDMAEPVNILSKLPPNFYDQIEAKKWQERKEMLEAAQKLCENIKLENGDYHDLVKVLKKVVAKDSNVMLVGIAAKCLAGLAAGLRKKFANHALGVVDVVLEKFKEKKVMVVEALRTCIDAVYLTTTLDVIAESCVASLDHKTPQVKAQTADFLARCFCRCTSTTLPKKLLKMFVAPLLKTINDTSPEVREASFKALGTAMKVVSEKHLQPFLADVDPLKLAKIKESCDSAELIGKSGKPKAAAAAAAPKKAAAAPGAKVVKPGAAAAASRPGTAKKSLAGGGGKKKAAGGGKAKKGGAKDDGPSENFLSDEAVEEKAAAALPSDVMSGLANSVWKERLAAMEKFTEVVKRLPKEDIPCQVFVRTIAKKPGLKETNFQVMKLKVELIAHLAKNSTFTRTSAECCLNDLVDKVGDVKNGTAVQEALSCISEAVGLEFVSLQVTNYAFEQKNPKNQSEALNWLAQAIREFGLKVNVKPMLGSIKKALAHTNPAVRTAGITLIGVLHMFMGATARMFFEDEKPALLQQIDAEIEKNGGSKPPAPVRFHGSATGGGAADDDEDDDEEKSDEEGGMNVADLVPRNDISDKITDTVISELSDTQWKVRAKALQDVSNILNEAKFITPNIGDLPTALALRLKKDSNKILVTTTLNILTTIATAMGPNIKRHVQTLGPGILGCCGDAKPALRATAVTTLNAWVQQAKLHPFLENEILSDALKLENPNLRAELFGWLAEKLPDMKKLPVELKDSLPYLYACLEDRNAGVRQKAAEAVLPFMIQIRYEPMLKAAQKIKSPSSKEVVMKALEAAKPNLPAKPVKAKPAKAAAAAAEPAAMDEDEPDEEEKPAPKAAAAKAVKGKGGKAKPGAKKGAAAASSKKKGADEDEETGPAMQVNNGKAQRFKEEKQLKLLKWNFKTPLQEFKDQLKLQMEPNFSKTLYDQMWHADFKKHIIAIDALDKELTNSPDAMIAQLDLVLKWFTIRFFDTNTSVLLRGLDFLQNLFNVLAEEDYHLHDLEATAFTPYLVNKIGDPKDNVRKSIRNLLKSLGKIYPASKMFSFMLEGLKSKNSRQRAECLEELGLLIDFYGINVCHPTPPAAIKVIAGQICDRDNPVRTAALNTLVIAYNIVGETVYKYVGKLNDKDMGMLEERIKRSGKLRGDSAPPANERTSPAAAEPKVARVMPYQNRPNTGDGRKPMGIARPRQVKRAFNLDFEDPDEQEESGVPQLVQHENLDELLTSSVTLPETRVRPLSSSGSRPLLSSTSDTKSAIDLVISQVASTDILTTIQALAQIDEVMKDEEKCELLGEHVDQLLVMCSMKLRMTRGRHLNYGGEDPAGVEEALQCYRSLLATVISIYQNKSLSKKPSLDVCKDLLLNLFSVLLDTRLEELEDGLQVVRSVNVTVVKIVDKGEPTCVLGALLKLLQESVSSETSSVKLLELIMKCLWKLCRGLPNFINDLDLERALMHVHLFMKAHPSSSWANKSSDMPLRTVKTIVHTLAKLKGAKIMAHLKLVDQPNSELELYLRKVLKSTGVDLATINAQNELNGTSPGRASNGVDLRSPTTDANKNSSKRLSKSTHDMLAEIFKKIGSKENTREGLNDLYDFKSKYPDADLEPFLKKSSQFFQNYIERGLKNIAAERDQRGNRPADSAIPHSKSAGSLYSTGSSSMTSANAGDDVNTNVYMERLKVLRARCGLDNQAPGEKTRPLSMSNLGSLVPGSGDVTAGVQGSGSNSSLSSSGSAEPQLGVQISKSAATRDDTTDTPAANVADLKKRLERIKLAARK